MDIKYSHLGINHNYYVIWFSGLQTQQFQFRVVGITGKYVFNVRVILGLEFYVYWQGASRT